MRAAKNSKHRRSSRSAVENHRRTGTFFRYTEATRDDGIFTSNLKGPQLTWYEHMLGLIGMLARGGR